MGQPPGWYPQQPQQYPAQQYPQQPHSPYGPAAPQPGFPPSPGYPGAPRPTSPAMAYTAAALFVPAIAMMFVAAVVGWDGTPDFESAGQAGLYLSLFALVFSFDITGNVDFAIAATMTLGCTTAVLALVMAFRVNFVRWLLAVVGFVAVGYYGYGVIDLASGGAAEYALLPGATLLFWLVPTVVVMLPPVGRAMRRNGQQNVAGAFGPGYGPGH